MNTPRATARIAAIALSASIAVAWLAPVAQATEKSHYSEASFACTSKESWNFGSAISKLVRQKLQGAPSDKDAAVNSFIVGYALKLVAKTPEAATLGEYFMYRAFYELNLLHFADRGFGSILDTPANPATQGIKIATLSCMNEIHRKYPSLGIAYNTAWSLGPLASNRLNENQRNAVWESMATIAGRKLFVAGRNAQIKGEQALLQGSGPYDAFVHAIEAMTLERDSAALTYLEQFLKFPGLPVYLKTQEDGAHLNLARLYYHAHEYEKSAKEFKKVKPQSNFFSAPYRTPPGRTSCSNSMPMPPAPLTILWSAISAKPSRPRPPSSSRCRSSKLPLQRGAGYARDIQEDVRQDLSLAFRLVPPAKDDADAALSACRHVSQIRHRRPRTARLGVDPLAGFYRGPKGAESDVRRAADRSRAGHRRRESVKGRVPQAPHDLQGNTCALHQQNPREPAEAHG